MKATKKLLCALAAGAALIAAAPVFADSGRDRGHDDYRGQFRHYDRGDHRFQHRGYDRRQFVVVRRPVFVPRPVHYAPPRPVYYVAPAPVVFGIGPAAIIGAAIGGLIDYHDYRR